MWLLAGGALLVSSVGSAGAQGVSQEQYAGEGAEAAAARIPSLEGRLARQDAALEDRISDISEVGEDLQETQARVDGAEARAGELREQTRELEQKIAAQKESYRQSKARYEEQARAAYQGRNLEGLGALIDGWLGSGRGAAAGGQLAGVARVLVDGRQDLAAYEESRAMLRDMVRQISQKERDYEAAIEEQRASAEELRARRLPWTSP
jgi:polyhydroxyalkanoate synthesis regulator phasin